MRIQSILLAGVKAASLVIIASLASIPGRADTIGFTYSFSGLVETTPPVVIGTTLFLDGAATGSILTGYPGLNAIWNPVTFHDTCEADLTTGILTGVFTMTFANSDTLSGNIFEDVSAVLATNTGPYTGTLTFTGGTGEFAGATGSASIGGVIGSTGSTASGSGTVTAAAITPEPASIALFGTGLLGLGAFASRKLVRQQR
jgi:hypothetical protein